MPADPDMAPPLIRVEGLHKRYGTRAAVSDLSFEVYPGQLCCLLGPNGAGKTTTMRVLVGLCRADRGSVEVLGEPMRLGAPGLHRVGVLIDGPAFVPHRSGIANLRLLWSASGQRWPPPGLEAALHFAGLGEAIERKVRDYSMGMKQRLMLAQALMREPRVVILDEPTNGLDPAEVRALRERLADLARGGAAVLISSHHLAEVEKLASHAIVLSHGRLRATGPLTGLLAAPEGGAAGGARRSLEDVFLAITEENNVDAAH